MRGPASLLAAVALLAACGAEEETAETGAAAPEPGVVDCGSYETRNEPPTSVQETANQCLIEAFEARRPAKLVATLTTVEGDPLPHHFTVRQDGTLELLVDVSEDQFRARGVTWYAYTCEALSQQAGQLSWDGCTERSVPKDLPLTNPQQPG